MRVKQPKGKKGSLRWMQALVQYHPTLLEAELRRLLCLSNEVSFGWRSPLSTDDYAEYRDGDFLDVLGLSTLTDALKAFWPTHGPQWDALACISDGSVVLIEAKAHASELRSDCAASPKSRSVIDHAFAKAKRYYGVKENSDWKRRYYQYANRLTHLYFLQTHGINASLVFLYFLNDQDMGGPKSQTDWETSLEIVYSSLGLTDQTRLRAVHNIFLDVSSLDLPSR